jgi:hypothetical protein
MRTKAEIKKRLEKYQRRMKRQLDNKINMNDMEYHGTNWAIAELKWMLNEKVAKK